MGGVDQGTVEAVARRLAPSAARAAFGDVCAWVRARHRAEIRVDVAPGTSVARAHDSPTMSDTSWPNHVEDAVDVVGEDAAVTRDFKRRVGLRGSRQRRTALCTLPRLDRRELRVPNDHLQRPRLENPRSRVIASRGSG
jgi:hypothetical protein